MSDPGSIIDLADLNPRSPTAAVGSPVSFVSMADVTETGVLAHVRVQPAAGGYTPFSDGDILVAKITPCMENGKGAHARGLPTANGQGSTEFHVLRAKPDTDERFLYHLTRTADFRRRAEAMMTGSAGQRRVPTEFFHKYVVRVPPLEEQRRIAEVLDTIDETIQATERVIAKSQSVHEGTTQALVDPATAPHDAPADWTRGRVLDFLHLQRGFDITKAEQQFGQVPVVSSSGISSYHTEARVRGPGVVTGRKGKLGRAFYIEKDFWPHDTALWVTDFKGNEPEFVALFLDSLQLERLDAATSVPTLNRNSVHPLPAAFPPVEIQREILSSLARGRARLVAETRYLEKLRATRSGLASDLLAGRVRTVAA